MLEHTILVNSNCYHGFSIEEAIEGIAAAGFHYIELTATKGWTEHVFADQTFARLVEVKHLLAEKHLIPLALSGHTNLMDMDRIGDFINNIEIAHFFGSRYIVSSIGEAHLKNKTEDSEALYRNIRQLLPLLETYDMMLVLEIHGEAGSGAAINEIVKTIDSDRVKINYDTANAIFYGGVDIIEDMKGCMENIAYMHIKDKAGEQKVWNFPALGDGDIDFGNVFEVLEDSHNEAPLSIEIEFTADGVSDVEQVHEAVRRSYAYLKQLGCQI